MASRIAFFLAIISALSHSRNSCPIVRLMPCRCVMDSIPWSHVYASLYLVQGLGSLVQAGERLGCSLFFCYGPCFSRARFPSGLGSPPVSSGLGTQSSLALCKPTAYTKWYPRFWTHISLMETKPKHPY